MTDFVDYQSLPVYGAVRDDGGALFNVMHRLYSAGAAIDAGAIDARAAFVALNTARPTGFAPAGTYRIASNMTLTKPFTLAPGAVIKPDAGVTVTFTKTTHLQLAQHFDTSNAGARIILARGTVPLVFAEWWGAKGDLAGTSTAQLAAATDDTLPIQQAVDCTIYGGTSVPVQLLGKLYKTTDTIHGGYGVSHTTNGQTHVFNSVVIQGMGYMAVAEPIFSGTAIVPTFSDRPAINFQGSRGSRAWRFTLYGKLAAYIAANNMGGMGGGVSLVDDTVAANWNDPSLAATQDSRYAPYAGIAIDAYSGVQPATHYPNVTFPAFLGSPAQYGKDFSSDVLIEDVEIIGFTVPVACQPCDADGNGDFVRLRNVTIAKCKWATSVGNSQSRGFIMDGVVVSEFYAVMTNNTHGRQIGKYSGNVNTMQCYGGINLFQFGSFYAMPIVFTNFYAESLWKIGSVAPASTVEGTIIFDGAQFNFAAQTDLRGYPASILDGAGAQLIDIQFRGGQAEYYKNIFQVNLFGVSYDGFSLRQITAKTNTYEKLAHNALAGGIVTPRFQALERSRIRYEPYNLDTGAATGLAASTKRCKASSRVTCIPLWTEGVQAASSDYDDLPPAPIAVSSFIAKSSLSSCSLSGKTLTIVFTSRADVTFMQSGPLPGDVIWDDQTGSVFFVRSRTTTTVLAELQNNYKTVVGVTTPLAAFSTTVGNLYWRNSRIYTPTFYTRGDFTAASNLITNVGRDDGGTGHVTTDIVALDALFIQEQRDLFINSADNPLTAVAATQLTMTANVNVRTQVRRRLDWFIRQPPANV